MSKNRRELIIVRSLTESDLGLFAAHRLSATSKQRAININSNIAQRLLSKKLFNVGGGDFHCICIFDNEIINDSRRIGKTGKNWRLGGNKINGAHFAKLDSKDFVLIRSIAGNDGSSPITIRFISKHTNRVVHAGLAAIVERKLNGSMILFEQTDDGFEDVSVHCPLANKIESSREKRHYKIERAPVKPMPLDRSNSQKRPRTIKEKLRSPHILERMLKAAGDMSAPAQYRFMETVDKLASQLRTLLIETGGIIRIEKNHSTFWPSVKGQRVGFVDGGLANLSGLGSVPVAARVGGYSVVPGEKGPAREDFTMLKYLIDELYSTIDGGIYDDSYPDISALRDAARISIEAAGAVKLLEKHTDLKWLLVHGALVNPVSRYSDVMRDGKVIHRFPDFSLKALKDFLPSHNNEPHGRERNFISVYLRQLELLKKAAPVVCGVIERESTTTSVCKATIDNLENDAIRDLLPEPPEQWKKWFKNAVDPSGDDDFEGQRITDSLLFRCVLEPGEAILPIPINRNELRRAPNAWQHEIIKYPQPFVFYIQVTEWTPPIRVEIFEKDIDKFHSVASLIMHSSLLLPKYAFPVGLDIVDKFAKIPNWMSRPINTYTTVRTMKLALDQGDSRLFDGLRRMLCGSERDFFLRPNLFR